jgi:predicted RNA-binding protein YlxR (DUF448 family)
MGTEARPSPPRDRTAIVELDQRELAELIRLVDAARRVQQPGSETAELERSLWIQLRASLATLA